MMNVTTGQHPGRPFTRGNRCRSTAERSTVQFGESVRLGGGAWPVVGPPDVRRGRSTGTDAEMARYFGRSQPDVPLRDMRPRVPSRTVALRRTGTSLSF